MSDLSLAEQIERYIADRASVKLEKFDKEADKSRAQLQSEPEKLAELERSLSQKRQDEETRFRPPAWLTEAAKRAGQISMVTHAVKFTHTDAKGTSLFSPPASNDEQSTYLTTASLTNPATDVVGNAAALDVAALLLLAADGETLVDQVARDDDSALRPFAESEQQLSDWLLGFKAALADRELSSHKLSKQIYFPVVEGGYHLISPLYASSLAQALYDRVADSRFSEPAKQARKARREGKYSDQIIVDYPATAVQGFGGTKPQNVSQLNAGRRGKAFLLNSRPPEWKTQLSPPTQGPDAFWRGYQRHVRGTVSQLSNFLVSVTDKDSNHRIRRYREVLVDELIEQLLEYAARIQGLRNQAGWSLKSSLPREEQLWLDPFREEKGFQKEREEGAWREAIANSFATWLNRKLRRNKLEVKDVEHIEWTGLVEQKLRFLKEDLEVSI